MDGLPLTITGVMPLAVALVDGSVASSVDTAWALAVEEVVAGAVVWDTVWDMAVVLAVEAEEALAVVAVLAVEEDAVDGVGNTPYPLSTRGGVSAPFSL